ncbi:XRE family transcriptional regulator [Actinobacillus pleuropneumoniae]|uniref:XRE family transcriptional regulator n=1 Tax=Actinobacillus pleuropneumoniae TaxID=715 RepID=UPI003B01E636
METDYKKVNGFGERLKKEREKAKLSRADVGDMLGGVAISTLQAWEGETREPPISKLMALAEILKTSANYLLTGEQSEPQEAKGIVARAFEALEKERAEQDEVEMLSSFESIEVSAGFGSFNVGVTEPDGQVPYDSNLLRNLGVKPKHCGVFWANGSSMLPTIHNGDQLLVDFSRNEVRNDNIYLVQNGDSVWVKRVKMLWDGVELVSDNREEYEPIKISNQEAQNLQIIGQVVHIGHSLI